MLFDLSAFLGYSYYSVFVKLWFFFHQWHVLRWLFNLSLLTLKFTRLTLFWWWGIFFIQQIFEAFFNKCPNDCFQISFSNNVHILFHYFNFWDSHCFTASLLFLYHACLKFRNLWLFVWTIFRSTATFLSEDLYFLL